MVTFGFLVFRAMIESGALSPLGSRGEQATSGIWLSWSVPYFVAGLSMQGRKLRAPRG